MRLYIVRHADPDYEHDTITDAGRLEALALADRFAEIRPDRLYCSPMGRAKATIDPTARKLGLPYDIEEWTHEIGELWLNDTPWGSTAAWDLPGELFRGADLSAESAGWKLDETFAACGAEKVIAALRERSDEFLRRQGFSHEGAIYRPLREKNEEKIAVFCHGGFGLTWLACLLDIPLTAVWSSFWLPPTSVTTVLFDQRREGRAAPRCIGLGDVSHLYKAGLPVRPRGIKANFY